MIAEGRTSIEREVIDRNLRLLPSIDSLLSISQVAALQEHYGRELVKAVSQQVVDGWRTKILSGANAPLESTLAEGIAAQVQSIFEPRPQSVINATGVLIHTNLGRAPLGASATAEVIRVASGYSTLEYDLDSGERGSRTSHVEELLIRATSCEAALVVNNNAAAVLLMLSALCKGQEVIINRGQLIEIGGGFRIPDILNQSGARLVEVGTTNRTRLSDYENAIKENTGAIFIAHHSNFKIVGFTEEPTLSDLLDLGQRRNVPVLIDQGSGAMREMAHYGLDIEPSVRNLIGLGADVVAFSGDKLLGGPQAGILCGRSKYIGQLKRHPLARAVRADKMCLAALAATVGHYLKGDEQHNIPIWKMIQMPYSTLQERASQWVARLQGLDLSIDQIEGMSTIGGGSLPGSTIPTSLLAISHPRINRLADYLRKCDPPIIGRIQDNRLLFDPRTVLPEQDDMLLNGLLNAIDSTNLDQGE